MTAIEATDLTKRYGDIRALDGLSVAVDDGELFGLLGPNGAGKTTFMRVVTGQTPPDDGTARVLGVDPVERPREVRRRVGILPETESPPSMLTPREYFEFIAAVRSIGESTLEDRIDRWADRLAMADQLDTLASDLSRGQRQKVMIAAAFLHDPACVLIDEPLTNLDPMMQERVKRHLQRYRDDGGTVVLSTHNVDVAATLCTRVGVVDGGRLLGTVRPADLEGGDGLLDAFLELVDDKAAPIEA